MASHADGYFAIGKTHTVCEDYVRWGHTASGRAYVIVADGCSSSDDTDIGARLLVRAADMHLAAWVDPSDFRVNFKEIALVAKVFAKTMNMNPECLDATLLIAVETETQIAVYKMGDGVVAVRQRNGDSQYVSHEFKTGAPYYANYLTNERRHQQFRDMPNNDVVVTYGINGTETQTTQSMHDYAMSLDVPLLFDKSEVDLVVLTTDGSGSFRKGLDPVPLTEIVNQVLAVKASAGEFMVRRVKKFLGSHCVTQGWHHDDDFGVGAIFVDPEVVS